MEIEPYFKDKTGILTELINNTDSEEILKSCIIEINGSKNDSDNTLSFNEVIDSYDIETLYRKYGMMGVDDVDKLDLKKLINSL